MIKTLVVDGNNILMRSIKAAEGRMHLSVEYAGEEINTAPLLLFINMLAKYVRNTDPDRMVVCWDGGRSAHRLAIYPDYKMARHDRGEEKDDTPFSLAKRFLSLCDIHHLEVPDVEADDLVAAYVHRHDDAAEQVVIVSGDKDFLQLLGPGVTQIRPGGGPTPESEVWTYERVSTEMGCLPNELASVMALTGDTGDGVPGIPGFGTKTAVKYLAKYDWDLDALRVSGEAKIAGHEDEIRRNLALVDLTRPIGVMVPAPPRFHPTDGSSLRYYDLLSWLDALHMDSVKDRLMSETLWK